MLLARLLLLSGRVDRRTRTLPSQLLNRSMCLGQCSLQPQASRVALTPRLVQGLDLGPKRANLTEKRENRKSGALGF